MVGVGEGKMIESPSSNPDFFLDTLLKINMEHNHGGLEDHFPF